MLVSDKAIAPSVGNKHGMPLRKRGLGYFYAGLLLAALAGAAFIGDWRCAWLSGLQADAIYKQLSGLAIVAYLAHQWHCSFLRNKGLMRKAGRILHRHKLVGSFAPVIFYAHAQSLGFGYQQLLSLVFFAVFLTGLFNIETLHINKPWFHSLWVIIHVSLSTSLLFLLGYHIFISYAYR